MELNLKMASNEVKNFINHMINNNRAMADLGKTPIAVELVSKPGLGKTQIGKQLAEENGMVFVKKSLAQFSDNGDLLGSPIRQVFMKNGEETAWVAINAVDEYHKLGFEVDPTVEPRTSFCKPSWIANEDKPIFLLLDDWTRATPDFLQAVMELIECQTFESWSLPKYSFIMLTSNPAEGDMQVNEIDDAMRTRFCSIELKWSASDWAAWAEIHHIDGRCINFVLHESDMIFNQKSQHANIVNPRTLVKFFDSILTVTGDYSKKENNTLVAICGNATVGPEVTNLFMNFVKNKLDRIPQPQDIYEEKDDKKICDLLEGILNDAGGYQNHIATMICERMINYTKLRIDSGKWKPTDANRLGVLCTNEKIFKQDAAFHVVRTLTLDPKYSSKLQVLYRNPKLNKCLIA